MADEIDITNERIERETAMRLARVRNYQLPAGNAGDCDLCGEWSGRLVGGVCAPCRDRHGLP